jgi:hypothetical protein
MLWKSSITVRLILRVHWSRALNICDYNIIRDILLHGRCCLRNIIHTVLPRDLGWWVARNRTCYLLWLHWIYLLDLWFLINWRESCLLGYRTLALRSTLLVLTWINRLLADRRETLWSWLTLSRRLVLRLAKCTINMNRRPLTLRWLQKLLLSLVSWVCLTLILRRFVDPLHVNIDTLHHDLVEFVSHHILVGI